MRPIDKADKEGAIRRTFPHTCEWCKKVFNAFYHPECPYCSEVVINDLQKKKKKKESK